jgi:hypothetical protein
VFLTTVAEVDLTTATLSAPAIELSVPAITGRDATPTPEGIYLLRRAHSAQLKMDILIFMQDGREVWAVHPNLPTRARALQSGSTQGRRLSAGCVGIAPEAFAALWARKGEIVLHVFRSQRQRPTK